jgi:DNA-binding NarL/FixJ family response regulator
LQGKNQQKKMNIILFDKQDITRFGLETLITELRPEEHSLFCADTKSALVQNLISNPESLVIIDYTLSDLNSVDSLLNISVRFPETHWVLFSEDLSLQFLKIVACNSAFSIILKTSDLAEIKKALQLAFDKQTFVCSHITELLSLSDKGSERNNDPLTLTEKEILRGIALGKSAKEIAVLRNISVHTVVTHRRNLYRKLEVNNSQEAAGYALRAGIIDTSDYSI